jgi:hypothetical protein
VLSKSRCGVDGQACMQPHLMNCGWVLN